MKGTKLFDTELLSILVPVFECLSIANFIFTFALITVIIKATPKSMKSFEFYLLQYACFTLILETVLAVCMPIMLHPYFYFYPAGIARLLPPNVTFAVLLIGFCSAVAALDCCIVMTLKRYYALKAAHLDFTRLPFYTYCFLTGSNICILVASLVVIFVKPISAVFRVLPEEVPDYVSTSIDGLENIINIECLIIFKASSLSSFPIFIIGGILFISIRLILALISLILNIKSSKTSKIRISITLQKRNDILRLLTYIQFSGYLFLLCFPVSIIIATYYFIPRPSNIVTFCIIIMNSFGLWDTVLTLVFIRPYRMYLFHSMYRCISNKSTKFNHDMEMGIIDKGVSVSVRASSTIF